MEVFILNDHVKYEGQSLISSFHTREQAIARALELEKDDDGLIYDWVVYKVAMDGGKPEVVWTLRHHRGADA